MRWNDMPTDTETLIHHLENLVKEKLRATPPPPPDERVRLMELLGFIGKLSGIQRLRELLIKTQRELEEARSAPLEYGVFLGVCPPRPKRQILDENGQPIELGSDNDLLWEMLSDVLNEAISRAILPDERKRLEMLRDELHAILVTQRDVIVGYNGQRLEVKLAAPDLPIEQLREGQQVVLNRSRNVVGIRQDFLRGETAEVTAILSPENAARVLAAPDGVNLRVQWLSGEKFSVLCDPTLAETLKRGDIVQIDASGKHAVAKIRPRLQVRVGSTDSVVEISDRLFQDSVEVGDTVRVDPRIGIAFEKLPAPESSSLTLEQVPDVRYEDIGGLDEQIVTIRDAIELPYIYRNLFDEFQLDRPKGILLYGPPGCGKTLIAKAVANSLTLSIRAYLTRLAQLIEIYLKLRANPQDAEALEAFRALRGEEAVPNLFEIAEELRLNNVDLDDPSASLARINDVLRRKDGIRSYFLNVKGPELLNKYVGETESRIRKIFEDAKARASFYTPVVIFFDEMEALFRTRGSGRSSDVETTIVPQFLAEMDGVEGSENVIIIGASNRSDMIDPAILRPGRLDVKIKINRPTQEAALQIMSLYLTPDLPLSDADLPQAPEAYGRNVTFKTATARRCIELFGAFLPESTRNALSQALPEKHDVRKALDPREPNGAALRALAESDPEAHALLTEIARREQLAEALIVETLKVLYSATSRLETSVRAPNGASERLVFPLRDFSSGAVLMSLVSRAKKTALKRQIAAGSGKVGITLSDLRVALADEFRENAEQFVAHWMNENIGVGAARQGDISAVKIFLEAAEDDPWGIEKRKPYQTAQPHAQPSSA
jgi:proteasome-associated ATPase